MTGSGTIDQHESERPRAWRRAGERVSVGSSDLWATAAAFVLTAVSIGLLAADDGGYFPGAWRLATPLSAVLIAVGFSAAVGVFFGFYPARKAAALNPIDALRYE